MFTAYWASIVTASLDLKRDALQSKDPQCEHQVEGVTAGNEFFVAESSLTVSCGFAKRPAANE